MDLGRARDAAASTVSYARDTLGEEAWHEAMAPQIPRTEPIPNPYTYSEYRGRGVAVRQEEP